MVYSHRDMIFHKSVDSTGHSKTKEYIFKLMDKVVDEVGEENVVQVVTDNEASFKAAGEMLMDKRKHLYWTPCAAHCVDLMLEEIGSLKHIKEVIDKSRKITSVIYNSAQAVNHMRDNYTGGRDLLRPGITRFATEHVALESLLRHKHPLQRCFTDERFLSYVGINDKKKKSIVEGVCENVLDKSFWHRVDEVCKVMEPLVKVLKVVDQDKKPTMPYIYEAMDRAKRSIETIRNHKTYIKIIDSRWNRQLHNNLHAAGNV